MKAVDRLPLLLIPAAAAVPIIPMAMHGPSYGHDILFHLLNWMEAARQFTHGTFHLHWAYTPAYNAGEPRFIFYPPLSWTLGALLGLVLMHLPAITAEAAWAAVPILFIWICLTASGFSMYYAARAFSSRNAALIGSAIYIANPYMLFTAYERSAYAELLAAAWMPLLLLAILAPQVRVLRVAIPVTLLWLTNAPAAVIGCYTVAAIAVFRAVADVGGGAKLSEAAHPRIRNFSANAAGLVLGVGLAGFYLFPAALERSLVQVSMATLEGMRIDSNFLFEHTGTSPDALDHDGVLHTASCIAVILLIGSALSLGASAFVTRRRIHGASRTLPAAPFACMLGLTVFLLTPWSNFVWQHAPELTFLQFPWRLLFVVASIGAVAVSSALSGIRLNQLATIGISLAIVGALTVSAYISFRQYADDDETVAYRLHAFQQGKGAEPTDEYTPRGADNDVLTPGSPGYWLGSTAAASAPANMPPAQTPLHFSIVAGRPEFLILNVREYPAWQVFLNGQSQVLKPQRKDGLIALAVPSGPSTVDLRYARMPEDLPGDIASFASLLAAAVLFIREKRSYRPSWST